ncbi:N-methyl-L-tryptophan oxidase [Cohnella herbarum]|uniref:N-methyl-L-tryptophan oxidase n=2 Tax=Cohnella herbarum TaxID=2728023 RepID=A0A7Z2ZPU2_9BACL|nr:N-methyl-L-tryptophan oxidase [Cohnella herbarum]
MGMSAGYELSRRGLKTLLIDAFDPPHPNGSHHGEPRLIRHAYSGGPAYVKLALRADELWRELEEATGEKLLERAGVLNIADPDVYSYAGRFQDAADHGVRIEDLDADQIRFRWPDVRIPDHYRAMFEPNAGYLYSEKCVAAYKKLALHSGASLLPNTFVKRIQAERSFVSVFTNTEHFIANHVILSAGAWFKTLEPFVRLPIRSVRKVVGWFEPSVSSFEAGTFPGFTFASSLGSYYGFPDIAGAGVKIGRHETGEEWQPGEDLVPFGAYSEDEGDLRKALEAYMPDAAGKLLKSAVCKYEHTPDDHFIIDTHPEHSNVILAGGFSGHGFKFASVVGEILANQIELGHWGRDVGLFSAARFSPISP